MPRVAVKHLGQGPKGPGRERPAGVDRPQGGSPHPSAPPRSSRALVAACGMLLVLNGVQFLLWHGRGDAKHSAANPCEGELRAAETALSRAREAAEEAVRESEQAVKKAKDEGEACERERRRLRVTKAGLKRGYEDLEGKSAGELAREVVTLRGKLQENSRLRVSPGNGDLLKMDDQELVDEIQRLRKTLPLLERCRKLDKLMDRTEAADLQTQGYRCKASSVDMRRYLDYEPGGACPNDWYFVQRLMFKKDCFALPRRRCRAITPAQPREPLPRPEALFSQAALSDSSVRWDLHQCKSFQCLNQRKHGDCLNCFNLALESRRWTQPFRGTLPMAEVIALKNGTLRIGLDAGGGTGSFAAHMARFGVTVMTTAFNVETVMGKYAGLPYMETIALRGLIPLHVPHGARLPFFDGTLDVIHSVNSIKFIEPPFFEELIYEWDRVLRVGGILWFEMFYVSEEKMPTYISIINKLGYKNLYWNLTPKEDHGEERGNMLYLNAIIEKMPNPGNEVLDGPRDEDMHEIV